MHYLFGKFGGINKSSQEEMIKLLKRNKAVPMIINLKDTISESLENIIRHRQTDSLVRNKELGFIFLFDGLDELSEEKADQVLQYINYLEQQAQTRKIIISCRSGNSNRNKVSSYLNDISEFKFCNLDNSHIERFFEAKNKNQKITALKQLQKSNHEIIKEIEDILLVRLLWETVEVLDSNSTVNDLIEHKVNLLLREPDHKKNIDNLNLLDHKHKAIMLLNQELSYEYQRRFQYRFNQSELQDFILNRFPRLDYKSVNELLNYQSDLFFERSYIDNDYVPSFIYQHKRYQEFFFSQKLKTEYEKNPKILRELDVLSNRDFFEGYFLPYLRKNYVRDDYIIGLLDINLIDVYLGNHGGFGVDDAYYLNSHEFIPALANQNDKFIEELLESENFQLKKVLLIDISALENKFKIWRENKSDYRINNYLISIWEDGLSSLLEHIAFFYKLGKRKIAIELLRNHDQVKQIYKENRFHELQVRKSGIEDPYWKRWEDHLYIEIAIERRNITDVFETWIRGNYKQFDDKFPFFSIEETGKDKLIKSFFRVVLNHKPNALLKVTHLLDDNELLAFLDVMKSHEYLGLLLNDDSWLKKINLLIQKRKIATSEDNYFVAFYKKLLNIQLTEDEIRILEELSRKLRDRRPIDWQIYNIAKVYAIVSFALDINNFNYFKAAPTRFRYYFGSALYSALFASLVKLKQRKTTTREIIQDYIDYVETSDNRLGLDLKREISAIWADIFKEAKESLSIEDITTLSKRLFQEKYNLIIYSFYDRLFKIDKEFFSRIINESSLQKLENSLEKDAKDFQTLVNNSFALANFYAAINENKSRFYFIKGLKDSILRHGWRKDTLVSYSLVNALEILWRNNFESEERLIGLTNEVFDLTIRVSEVTDGSETLDGPYNVLKLASKYDIELAKSLERKLIERWQDARLINKAVAIVLLGKIRLGLPFREIEEKISTLRNIYDVEGKQTSASYIDKINSYISIAESELYSDEERLASFNKAFELVDEMNESHSRDKLNDNYSLRYLNLCRFYNVEPNISPVESIELSKRKSIPEQDLIQEIRKAETKAKVNGLYRRIHNYKNGLLLTQKETWQILLQQTYKVMGNISPFINLLQKSSYPHTDWYYENSNYFHLGLAVALSDMNMKSETIKYLYRNTGHEGFLHIMKAYEVIGNKKMCSKLFQRYLQLCHLLCD